MYVIHSEGELRNLLKYFSLLLDISKAVRCTKKNYAQNLQ